MQISDVNLILLVEVTVPGQYLGPVVPQQVVHSQKTTWDVRTYEAPGRNLFLLYLMPGSPLVGVL